MRASQVNVRIGLNTFTVEQMVAYTAESVEFDLAEMKLLIMRSLKVLFFCFFSGATAENVYQAMHNFVMQLALRGLKK